jgi:hypothetical protein
MCSFDHSVRLQSAALGIEIDDHTKKILSVRDGGQCEQNGVRAGMKLVGINDQPLEKCLRNLDSSSELAQFIAGKIGSGEPVSLNFSDVPNDQPRKRNFTKSPAPTEHTPTKPEAADSSGYQSLSFKLSSPTLGIVVDDSTMAVREVCAWQESQCASKGVCEGMTIAGINTKPLSKWLSNPGSTAELGEFIQQKFSNKEPVVIHFNALPDTMSLDDFLKSASNGKPKDTEYQKFRNIIVRGIQVTKQHQHHSNVLHKESTRVLYMDKHMVTLNCGKRLGQASKSYPVFEIKAIEPTKIKTQFVVSMSNGDKLACKVSSQNSRDMLVQFMKQIIAEKQSENQSNRSVIASP